MRFPKDRAVVEFMRKLDCQELALDLGSDTFPCQIRAAKIQQRPNIQRIQAWDGKVVKSHVAAESARSAVVASPAKHVGLNLKRLDVHLGVLERDVALHAHIEPSSANRFHWHSPSEILGAIAITHCQASIRSEMQLSCLPGTRTPS